MILKVPPNTTMKKRIRKNQESRMQAAFCSAEDVGMFMTSLKSRRSTGWENKIIEEEIVGNNCMYQYIVFRMKLQLLFSCLGYQKDQTLNVNTLFSPTETL